jgi:hypothetical protein
VLIAEERGLRVGPGCIFGDLLEAGMLRDLFFGPEGGGGEAVRDGQFVLPHHPIFLGVALAREVARCFLAGLGIEEVAEVGGLDLGEVALAHTEFIIIGRRFKKQGSRGGRNGKGRCG